MSNEPNEDLIEATIRRVAAAKAEREAQETDDQPEPPPAAEVSSRESDAGPLAEAAVVGAAPEPAAAPGPAVSPEPAAAQVDDDLIEATIRRVAAARAAREAETAAPAGESDEVAVPAEPPLLRPVPAARPPAVDGGGHWAAEMHTLRQEVEAMQGMLRELQARVDAALAIAGAAGPARGASDDEWDDAPALPRIPLGQPVRPAIFRDPSPRSATAEELEPAVDEIAANSRPVARPSSPSQADVKRGLDLLPRTYRLTVEDKRRGVDLVPLHRALLGMDGVRDMSLLSYSNGVAIIAVEMVHELNPQALEAAVARAMSRAAKVEVHNESTMVVKLAEE